MEVRNFQRTQGIIVDGIVGIQTWNQLFVCKRIKESSS
ncbi:peptidoglycan-binding protein [Halalkalibacter sp. APA_J-10(15)]